MNTKASAGVLVSGRDQFGVRTGSDEWHLRDQVANGRRFDAGNDMRPNSWRRVRRVVGGRALIHLLGYMTLVLYSGGDVDR